MNDEATSNNPVDETVRITGSVDQGFKPHIDKPRAVLIGANNGMASMIFLAEALRDRHDAHWKPLVFLEAGHAFPFRMRPSTIIVDGMPDGVIAGLSVLDEQGIPSRLSSPADLPGCYDGSIIDLADAWLATLNNDTLKEVEVFVCGPTPLLKSTAKVARKFGVVCQVSMDK